MVIVLVVTELEVKFRNLRERCIYHRDVQDEETGVRRLVVPAGSGHIARQTITGGIKSRLGHTGSVKARLGLEREEEENR